jgi:hypothetical protein
MTDEPTTPTVTLLSNTHVSPETAYVVVDYPYGFKLRCKIRYWIDCNPRHGARFVSQTTDPRKAGEVWNKPKTSTYCRFGGALYLDARGHVRWAGLTEYADGAEALAFRETYGAAVPEALRSLMTAWVEGKLAYDAQLEAGAEAREASAVARIAYARALAEEAKR